MNNALEILDEMGPVAKDAVRALRAMYKRSQFDFEREKVLHALDKIDKDAANELR